MTPLEKMTFFEMEIAKATIPSNLLKQQSNFEEIHSEILKYLNTEMKDTDANSRIIQMILGKLKYIKDEHMSMSFIKDSTKRAELLSKKIVETEKALKAEIDILKMYIVVGIIVKK